VLAVGLGQREVCPQNCTRALFLENCSSSAHDPGMPHFFRLLQSPQIEVSDFIENFSAASNHAQNAHNRAAGPFICPGTKHSHARYLFITLLVSIASASHDSSLELRAGHNARGRQYRSNLWGRRRKQAGRLASLDHFWCLADELALAIAVVQRKGRKQIPGALRAPQRRRFSNPSSKRGCPWFGGR